jgi:hypothetical protein
VTTVGKDCDAQSHRAQEKVPFLARLSVFEVDAFWFVMPTSYSFDGPESAKMGIGSANSRLKLRVE